ncbi:MAG: ABC transporter permease [Clostridia bacterium]|nr:ABC transporter permease [Clostridia bacterium]
MKKLLKYIYLALMIVFLYAPIFVLIVFSFNSTKSHSVLSGFTLKWYTELFSDRVIMSSLLTTIIVAVSASVISTILGTFAAYGINSMSKISKTVALNTNNIPIINPEIVTGVSLMLLFVFFAARMHFKMGYITLIIAHITFDTPYVVLNIMPKFRQMDKNLVDAAEDLGCNGIQAFFKVVLPDIFPGVISGFLMAFTFSLDDFIVSYFVSGTSVQTLPITIYSMTRKQVSPKINALSTIIFIVVLIVLVTKNVIENNRDKKLKLNNE